jgi:GNAT superfamily N-acetyltransferase
MEVYKVKANSDKKIFYNIAELHKNSLKKTIASTLSVKALGKVYKQLVEKKIFVVHAVEVELNIVGTLSYRFKNKKISLFTMMSILPYILYGFLRHPMVWFIELYYKLGLYKNISSEVNIVTLFVDKEFQKNNIGQKLIESVVAIHKNDLTVDTRVSNTGGLRFYEKNNFKIVSKNSKNIVLKYQK